MVFTLFEYTFVSMEYNFQQRKKTFSTILVALTKAPGLAIDGIF